jgi:GBP family porin
LNKKKLVVLATLLAVKSAFAQTAAGSAIEIYGVMDIGIGHDSHALSESPDYATGLAPNITKTGNNAVTGMFNGGLAPSRIGFRGSEDLGGGLKAIFDLETGFNPQFGSISNAPQSVTSNSGKTATSYNSDASVAGQLFNRQAYVGLSSKDWGTITAGRNYSLGYDTISNFDPMNGSAVFSPLGYSGSYAGGGFTEDFRLDNSVHYKYEAQGFNVGALYKFGGQSGSTSAQSVAQLTGGYAYGPFAIQATYSNVKDGFNLTNSTTQGTAALTVADTKSFMVAASYKIDQVRIRGGYQRQEFNNPSNPDLDKGITTVLGATISSVSVTAFTHEKKLDVYFIGGTYDFSQAFSTSVGFYDVQQNDYSAGACTTGSNVATCSGSSKFYSILGDYKLSKRTDVYAGYMYNRVDGGLASGFLQDGNGLLGVGIKHTF